MNPVIDQVRREANRLLDSQRRVELGQYFTSAALAEFMAGLFSYTSPIKLLDAGAGTGALTAAFLDEALRQDARVEADVWEIDPFIARYLQNTLQDYAPHTRCQLHLADFIEEAAFSLQFGGGNRYTHAILNPPYKKISSQSKHRQLLRKVGIETVNLYAAFVALAILLLKTGGELVAILPRSFCNGSYYRPFREQLLRTCAIRQLHLFESRSHAFQEDTVLQENIIIHLVKGVPQAAVIVSGSQNATFLHYQENIFPASDIVKPGDSAQFIHIPTTTLTLPAFCRHTLRDLGLSVCTGPVVDFRLKTDWRADPDSDTAPLLYPHHFKSGSLTWPMPHKKPNALTLSAAVKKWLMPRGHYVLVKRFSSKEEPRRLVAYPLSPDVLPAAEIGFENHWNVFHIDKHGIDAELTLGLATFLNSTRLDQYFRAFSGHTQVNASDLRNLHYPSLSQLRTLGQRAANHPTDQAAIDHLIESLHTP